MTRHPVHFGAALMLALAMGTACRNGPTAGSKCHIPEQVACAASDRALECAGDSWVELPCRGALGCSRRGDTDECDDTVAVENDPCARNPPIDYACTSDRAKALVCRNGRFSLWRPCRGPDRCEIIDGRRVHCDTTLGEPGDPCEKPGAYSCSVDRTLILTCNDSMMVAASSCRGPQGCGVRRDAGKVDCDDSFALDGDPCEKPRRITCSTDGKSELVCAENRYSKKRDCRRTDCKLEGNQLFCD